MCLIVMRHCARFLKSFVFCIGVQLINNAVIVSGGQQRDSAIHIHVFILPQTPLPSRLPHNIKQNLFNECVHFSQIIRIFFCKDL